MDIVIACDQRFAQPAAITVSSLIASMSPNAALHVYLLDCGLEPLTLLSLKKCWKDPRVAVTPIAINLQKLSPLPSLVAGCSLATYARLLLGSVLPPTLTKVLYLDCDILVRKDVGPLWAMDMKNKTALAAVNFGMPYVGLMAKTSPFLKDLKIPLNTRYYNAGVMLLDLKKWRSQNVERRCFDLILKFRSKIGLMDQCVLNAALIGDIGELDPKWNAWGRLSLFKTWNAVGYPRNVLKEALLDPAIFHFAMHPKPWDRGSKGNFVEEYVRFAKDHAAEGNIPWPQRNERIVPAPSFLNNGRWSALLALVRFIQARASGVKTGESIFSISRIALTHLLLPKKRLDGFGWGSLLVSRV